AGLAVVRCGRYLTPALVAHPGRVPAPAPDWTLPPSETHLRKYYENTTVRLRGTPGIVWASPYNPHHTCTRGALEASGRAPPPHRTHAHTRRARHHTDDDHRREPRWTADGTARWESWHWSAYWGSAGVGAGRRTPPRATPRGTRPAAPTRCSTPP